MSFFKKLKERMFRSSSKLDEGLEALIDTAGEKAEVPSQAATEPAPAPQPPAPDEKPGLLGRMLGRDDAPRRVLDDEMLEQLEEEIAADEAAVDSEE